MDAPYTLYRCTHLPPELWTLIFRHASSRTRFFDSNWDTDHCILTPFIDDDKDKDILESFTASLETLKAISLVCTGWRAHSLKLMYSRIYLRRASQLRSLVHTLERSRDEAKGRHGLASVGLGWWVTHIKMQALDERESINGPTYLDRLLACCPRLEVYLDARRYGYHERPKEILASFKSYSNSPSKYLLRSLVWSYGGPLMDDLASGQHILDDIRSLRCMTVHSHAVDTLSNSLLTFPKLISIDLFISSQLHRHWLIIAQHWSLPNLTHIIIRTPVHSRGIIGPAATRCLYTFLEAHGSNITSLELAIHPGDESRPEGQNAVNAEFSTLSIPSLLSFLPNLQDLVLSARWQVDNAGDVLWHHPSLRRVGLRDAASRAPDFSPTRGHLPCVCATCRHIGGLIAGLENILYGRQRHAYPHLTRRQCSINKLLNTFLDVDRHPYSVESFYEAPTSFPNLQSIYLIDSDMIDSDVDGMGRYPLDEEQFWMARVVRCALRNVQLCGRDGVIFRPESNSLRGRYQQSGRRGMTAVEVSPGQSGLLALVLRLIHRLPS